MDDKENGVMLIAIIAAIVGLATGYIGGVAKADRDREKAYSEGYKAAIESMKLLNDPQSGEDF